MTNNPQRKIRSDFPELKISTVENIGEGWDNEAYLVNNEIVFRVPKSRSLHTLKEQIAHSAVEVNVLHKLKNKLSVNTPKIMYAASDESYYGYSYSKGKKLNAKLLSNKKEFVRIWVESVVEISNIIGLEEADSIGLEEFPFNNYRIKRAKEVISSGILSDNLMNVTKVSIARYEQNWGNAKKVVVHGDLGLGNWVYDDEANTYTIIDWSDVCIAPQEFQMWRLIEELPDQIDFASNLYESKAGYKLNKLLIYDCGIISNLSIIGALLEKEGAGNQQLTNKMTQLEKWSRLKY